MKGTIFTDGKKIEVNIQSLAASGSGVGHIIENGFKKPVFIRYTVPGDVVIAQIVKQLRQ